MRLRRRTKGSGKGQGQRSKNEKGKVKGKGPGHSPFWQLMEQNSKMLQLLTNQKLDSGASCAINWPRIIVVLEPRDHIVRKGIRDASIVVSGRKDRIEGMVLLMVRTTSPMIRSLKMI